MKLNLKIVAATTAVAMMSTGAAHAAASITTVAATYSQEALTAYGTVGVDLPTIRVTFGNALTYQDDIFITLPGVTSVAAVPAPLLVTCASGSAGPIPSVGYVTTVAGGWNFRVTSVAGLTIGDYCDFGVPVTAPLKVQGGSLAGATGDLLYQANRFQTGQLVDSAKNDTDISIRSQYGISGNSGAPPALSPLAPAYIALNGDIDVYTGRVQFAEAEDVGAGTAAAPVGLKNDSLAFQTMTDGNVTFFGPVVTTTKQVVTINGSFAWSDTLAPAGACFDAGINDSVGAFTRDTALSNCNSLVLNGPVTDANFNGFFQVPGNKILSATDWLGAADFSYTIAVPTAGTKTGKVSLEWDPGIWTINGAQVYVPYMPYGENIGRIVYVSNTGVAAVTGEVDVYANGSMFTCDLGSLAARTVTQLSAVLDACVAGQGITSGKVAFLMTFIARDVDIEVYSAYNVNSNDRGTVVNTSNGRGLSYFSRVDN